MQKWYGVLESFVWFLLACVAMEAIIASYYDFRKDNVVEPPVIIFEEGAFEREENVEVQKDVPDNDQLECLALNTYHESRGESIAGQLAVAQVVMNRVKSKRFPDSVCEVVKQGPTYVNWKGNELPVLNKCHFSWYCDGKSDNYNPKTLDTIRTLVVAVMVDPLDYTDGATHYHADYVDPWWAKHYEVTTQIDDHIFYR